MNLSDKARLLQTSVLSTLFVGFAVPAFAQVVEDDEATSPVAEQIADEQQFEESADEIVVTGSRIKRDTFSSISPLQVITADTVIDAGLTNTADIVKSQTVISGVQLDTNINSSFVTNGGPGASNVSLRGLGEDRTLVLVNGRRFAPAGVEGAPSLPDLNLIPSSLVQRVDTLLDGASSVYGSDAIAGVVNVILRDEFDGFRIDGSFTEPFETGGETRRIGGLFGTTSDKGKFIAAIEYRQQDELDFQDRDFQRDENGLACSMDIEFDTNGDIRRQCDGAVGSQEFRTATSPFGDGAEIIPGSGFFNISNTNARPFRSIDLEATDNFINDQEALTAYVSAERELNLLGSEPTNLFFETSFSNVQTNVRNGFHGQLFPSVDSSNPTNPLSAFGVPLVPLTFSPIKRSDIDVDVIQYRMTAGIEGAVSFLPDWSYEAYASYSRSIGDSIRPVVLEDRLIESLATTVENPDGTLSCGVTNPDLFGFLTPATCVPVNLFAPSLYDSRNPQFATQAEFDFLSGERSVTTKVEQTVLSGFFTGPVFELPGGNVQVVLGAEYREDGLDSGTDTIASNGGAAGFFADRRSIGSVQQFEAFGEIDLPLVSGVTGIEDLSLNLAGRIVDNEFYPTEEVYSIKAGYSPVDFLTFKATYGTSFRSPGSRELFLGGQSGFVAGNNDPCIVPIGASIDDDGNPATDPIYDPTGDNRNPQVLANCVTEGVDPTSLGLGGSASIEAFRAGNPDLSPETSTAYTLGATFDQPFTDAFDLLFSASYFDIEVNNAPNVPTAGFILSQCYNSTDFPNDPFCQRRVRDPNTGFLTEINQTPFNLASFGAKGVDFNARGAFDFSAAGREFSVTSDNVLTYQFERESQNIADAPVADATGDFGFPEWRGNFNTRIATGDFSLFWGVRFIGGQDDLNTQTGEVIERDGDIRDAITGEIIDTRADFAVKQDIDDYFRHDVSVRYTGADDWSLVVGINNVFDEDPPLLDQDVGATLIGNVPAGIGYSTLGRSLFVTASKTF